MCAGALVLARVSTLVFGAWEPKTGAVGSLWDVVRDRRLNHRPAVYSGVLEDECAALVRGLLPLSRAAPSSRLPPLPCRLRDARRPLARRRRPVCGTAWQAAAQDAPAIAVSRPIRTMSPKPCSRWAESIFSPVLMWSLTVRMVSALAP